jgi:predicted 3-demethylubiquinone-9 3-methyltransferase (glyoxalase superfamily)
MTSITPYLWFDDNAEEAIELYSSIFPDVAVHHTARYPQGTPGAGTLMNAEIEIAGQRLLLLNGGPMYRFTEAFSFLVSVETQEEVDRYWNGLTAGGGEPGQCGWLKDKFGLSWQIIPTALMRLMSDPDPQVAGRVVQAMFAMQKLVIADLEAAAAG